jgi:glycosyltransferase involved in cell wall biosynthesis
MRLIQLNLQPVFGGGEVYTAFVTRTLAALGVPTTLVCHPAAGFWSRLGLPPETVLLPFDRWASLIPQLPQQPAWLLSHGPLPPSVARAVAPNHLLTGIAHMPLQGGRADRYDAYAMVFGVSNYVLAGLRDAGFRTWDEPFYGVADFRRFQGEARAESIRQTSAYAWDLRKGRDRLLSWLEPCVEPLRRRPCFEKRGGVTLGLVSRLTPIKQFPQQFAILAPVMARFPEVVLEVFGSGGYASVRDLKRSLAPVRGRVRFWGQQQDVATVYRGLDYLMTGLPEKEALGLNVIEAQACGTPVLAVNAPPFTETVLDGRTGFLYRDPRQDGGTDFAALLARLLTLAEPLRPREATEHLAGFALPAFTERLRRVAAWAADELR